uniref:Uncharacterized protein n=1 Tax=Anopheles maculatus TaxID=74869 RepID=A0A182S6D1_9DIPT
MAASAVKIWRQTEALVWEPRNRLIIASSGVMEGSGGSSIRLVPTIEQQCQLVHPQPTDKRQNGGFVLSSRATVAKILFNLAIKHLQHQLQHLWPMFLGHLCPSTGAGVTGILGFVLFRRDKHGQ